MVTCISMHSRNRYFGEEERLGWCDMPDIVKINDVVLDNGMKEECGIESATEL